MKVCVPASLDEALADCTSGDATVVAGGTDVMVDVGLDGRSRPRLVDLSRVGELATWTRSGREVHLGAAVTLTRCLEQFDPSVALAQACRAVGSRPIRNRATIGGNVVTASPAGDLLPFLVASDAVATIRCATRSTRQVRVAELLAGPRSSAVQPDELLTGLTWTEPEGPQSFLRASPRASMGLAVASSCLVVDREREEVRIALGAVAPTVIRARRAEEIAAEALSEVGWWDDEGVPLPPTLVQEASAAAAEASHPTDDVRASARYRRHAVRVLVERQLSGLVGSS